MYYILLNSLDQRTKLIDTLKKQNIYPVFHYVPLHSAPAGKQFGRTHGQLTHTENLSERLLRMPFWVGLGDQQNTVLHAMNV